MGSRSLKRGFLPKSIDLPWVSGMLESSARFQIVPKTLRICLNQCILIPRTIPYALKEVSKIIKNRDIFDNVECYTQNCIRSDFSQNRLISHDCHGCENRVLNIKYHQKLFIYVWINVFWYPEQCLRSWTKVEKSSKTITFW